MPSTCSIAVVQPVAGVASNKGNMSSCCLGVQVMLIQWPAPLNCNGGGAAVKVSDVECCFIVFFCLLGCLLELSLRLNVCFCFVLL